MVDLSVASTPLIAMITGIIVAIIAMVIFMRRKYANRAQSNLVIVVLPGHEPVAVVV